ncbi:hypothetical protein [Sanguibacter sp. HDW7]|uniref:hypothetical protein n=1 Tax=Sanguibacter sp. HDW7 TaxID=2714931 RepID=UPI00140B98EF|nr:hypothetical protein [Sanguibacter sp. HDW7]QIK82717.1 hypothetical protein G7063_03080 [Sanguibacter sp. HDW7]
MSFDARRTLRAALSGHAPRTALRGVRRVGRRGAERARDENGLVLVEASFIYPVVFAVLALLLYAGDMFYQRSWIEAAVLRYSIEGAAEVGNSAIENISVDNEAGTGVLNLGSLENDPYRFIANGGTDSNAGAKASANEASLRGEVAGGRASFFGLAPDLRSVDVDYTSSIVYGEYTVTADYGFQLPVASFLVPEGKMGVDFSAQSVSTVTSMGEFVRNVDFVDDIYAGAAEERAIIKDLAEAVTDFVTFVTGG